MRVITLIAESFNRYDLPVKHLENFRYFDFNTGPTVGSGGALCAMQCADPLRASERVWKITQSAVGLEPEYFDQPFIAQQAKTRLIGEVWPVPRPFAVDPLYKGEPTNAAALDKAYEFLSTFMESDYQHAIIWSMTGHVGYRHIDEGWGLPIIPSTLKSTWGRWQNEMASIFAIIPWNDVAVLIHNDHGTLRHNDLSDDANLFDGFLFLHAPPEYVPETPVTWRSVRRLYQELLDVRLPDDWN